MPRLHAIPMFSDGTATVKFVKLNAAGFPGMSHRVLVQLSPDQPFKSVGFLGNDFRPNAKAAAFFLDKALAAVT